MLYRKLNGHSYGGTICYEMKHYATIYKHRPCQNRNYYVLSPTLAIHKKSVLLCINCVSRLINIDIQIQIYKNGLCCDFFVDIQHTIKIWWIYI